MQTIGERLEDARKQKGISIRESAEATKIRGEYLQKFESNNFDISLSEIYVRGFLRTYAQFLKIPADRILNDYAALGRGEPRPRQPSREVYGRMDVSVASAGERADRTAPPADNPADHSRAQAKPSRTHTNLPAAPLVDPALVLKIGKISIGILVLVLVIWAAKAIFSGLTSGPAEPAKTATAPTPAVAQPAADPVVTLIALENVRVKVVVAADGRVLLPDTTLARGQTQIVPKPAAIFITASALENLAIEENGRRTLLRDQGFKGYDRVKLGK
jgi:transcriptional regulator with XRE-family HTH domain